MAGKDGRAEKETGNERLTNLSVAAAIAALLAFLGLIVRDVLTGGEISLSQFEVLVAITALFAAAPAFVLARRPRAPRIVKPMPPEVKTPELPTVEKGGVLSKLSQALAKPVSEKTRIRIVVASALMTLLLVLTATFAYPGYQSRPEYDNFMIGILVVGLIAPSVADVVDRRYRNAIDSRIPDFLREISESQRTGTPFTKSLVNAAQSNYGPLSTELSKSMAKMSWGMTFEESLDYFAHNVDTPLAHRAAVLLKEVGRSGGKMLEVLDSVYDHVREVVSLKKERSKQLTPYVMVIYASFGVYLFVVYILFSTFFAQVSHLQSSGSPFGSNINPATYYIWFFHMSVIEGVFGGLVIGKISAGSSISGLKHVLVLLTLSLFFFLFFVKY